MTATDRDRQRRELRLPPGLAGGGRRRYAAAMWLHGDGAMPEDALELYRTLALDDRADPDLELCRAGLRPRSLGGPWDDRGSSEGEAVPDRPRPPEEPA